MRPQHLSCILLSLMFLLLACTKTVEETSNKNSSGSAAQEAQNRASPVDQWTITETGIGGVKIGMTVAAQPHEDRPDGAGNGEQRPRL